MNRLQNRLGKVEGKMLPKSRDALLMRVPAGPEHWPKINGLLEEYRSRDCILWTDSGKSLPNRPLWQPFDIHDLDDQELDDVIADVKASIATTEAEPIDGSSDSTGESYSAVLKLLAPDSLKREIDSDGRF